MLSRRLLATRSLTRSLRTPLPFRAFSKTTPLRAGPDVEDPGMNGGYPVIKSEKREHRDPYAGWWDEQERRDYNETVHEDNDILGRFATEDYTWTTAGWGWVLMGSFVATFLGVLGVVYVTYPDKPAVPRTFPDGLEQELGGKGTMRAFKPGEEVEWAETRLERSSA